MSIVIFTNQLDVHAAAVDICLRRSGIPCHIWEMDNPDYSISLGVPASVHNDVKIEIRHGKARLCESDFGTIWYRRPRSFRSPLPEKHPDKEHSDQELAFQYRNFLSLIPSQTAWFNHFESARIANNKLLQLHKAKIEGLLVPESIVTTERQRVVDFLKARNGVALFKALSASGEWYENGKLYAQSAVKITENSLPSEQTFSASGGIVQEAIDKVYEIRALYLDGLFIAAKLSTDLSYVDIKSTPRSNRKVEPYVLPGKVESQLRKLMQSMNLRTGSIDLLKTNDGHYVFLEINEAGQFLWVEVMNPEIKVLGPFCKMLAKTYEGGNKFEPNVSLSDIFDSQDFKKYEAKFKEVRESV